MNRFEDIQNNSAKMLKIIQKHMDNGVVFNSTQGVYISEETTIGEGTTIDCNNIFKGKCVIGKNVKINDGNTLNNAVIGNGVTIIKSVVDNATIKQNTTVGPWANVHTRSVVERDCRIGNFVEIKNSNIGINTKMAHLAYIGDSDIGAKCNIGCGVIFVNYDGKNKHRSVVGDSVFIGSNSNIIAPIKIEDNSFIAAGTTVTINLPENCMCIGRNREVVKENRSKYRMCDYKKKYFGTDGIRGIYGEKLTDKIAYLVGNFLGYSADRGVIVLGRDSRKSGEILSSALMQGIIDADCDVIDLGITTTPSVAKIAMDTCANYGVVITASHNPSEYNGIKIFNDKGRKLLNIEEIQIEEHIEKDKPFVYSSKGKIIKKDELINNYIDFLCEDLPDLSHLKVVVDCSNGASVSLAKKVFGSLNINAKFIGVDSNGDNINKNCGALFPEMCAKEVVAGGFDLGFCFDGDADRIIAIDHKGKIISGDKILFAFAKDMKNRGILQGDTVVGTIMTNYGMENYLSKIGIKLERTNVGDHYVVERMLANGYMLGGESSGHIILGDKTTTGDGLLVALQICKLVVLSKQSLRLLTNIKEYPQINKNILTDKKDEIASDKEILDFASSYSDKLGEYGRAFIRASGTEKKLRITVECSDINVATNAANEIEKCIKNKYALNDWNFY